MQKVGLVYKKPLVVHEDAQKKNIYTPDFSNDNVLYEDGELNDISVMQNKPKYRALIESQQKTFDSLPTPDLSDQELADTMVSSDMDVNELCAMIDNDMRNIVNS